MMAYQAADKLAGDQLRKGMLFSSIMEAEDAVKSWATAIGFEVKRGHSKKNVMCKYSFSMLFLF